MPQTGEIRRAFEINHKGRSKYVWIACPDCGKFHWVPLDKGNPRWVRCRSCAVKFALRQYRMMHGGRPRNWKGRSSTGNGYIEVPLEPDDFFYPMANKRHYVLEHRLVMAKQLGRCLQPWEQVHHRDGVRHNNTPSNLLLTLQGIHDGKVKCPFCRNEFGIR